MVKVFGDWKYRVRPTSTIFLRCPCYRESFRTDQNRLVSALALLNLSLSEKVYAGASRYVISIPCASFDYWANYMNTFRLQWSLKYVLFGMIANTWLNMCIYFDVYQVISEVIVQGYGLTFLRKSSSDLLYSLKDSTYIACGYVSPFFSAALRLWHITSQQKYCVDNWNSTQCLSCGMISLLIILRSFCYYVDMASTSVSTSCNWYFVLAYIL